MLRYVTEGVIVLVKEVTRVAILVDVNLQVISFRHIKQEEHVLQIGFVLNRVLKEDRVSDCGLQRRHVFSQLSYLFSLFDAYFNAQPLLLSIIESMDGYAPNSTPKFWVFRVDKDLVGADLIRLEKVDVLVDLISIDSNVEIRV